MEPHLSDRFGNPSSLHAHGREARAALEDSRDALRTALGAAGGRVVFTGSGSESDNLAILGFARRHPGGRVIRSSIEHKAVLESSHALATGGYDVRDLPVDRRGVVDRDALADLLSGDERPTLVSVMWANNETGAVQPVAKISALCRERGARFHSDAVQAFGKVPIDLSATPVDLLTVSAHKIGGPKGTGALYVAEDIELEPIVYGGGQESGLRSGTQDLAAIVGFAVAAERVVAELGTEPERWRALRDRLESALRHALPGLAVNAGDAPERLPNVLNVSIPAVDIEALITSFDLEGICVSTGSACTTGSVEPSHVLVAMGRQGELARNTVRISLGHDSRAAEIDRVIEVFPAMVDRVRRFAPTA